MRSRQATAARALLVRENAAIDRLLARQPFITAGGSERREIALTFDDGPGPYTPRLLDQLQRLHAPATFFEVGFMIHYFYDSLERQVRIGAVVGDHTEQHAMMAHLPAAQQADQIIVQTQQLHRYGAPYPRLYRPPYGSFNQATFAILHRLRMLMVLWSVDTEDYLTARRRCNRFTGALGREAGCDHPDARRRRRAQRDDRRAARGSCTVCAPAATSSSRSHSWSWTIHRRGHEPTPTSLAGD